MIFTGYEIFGILIIHWIADFILQTHWQASNKSKNNKALLAHTITYMCAVILMMMAIHVLHDMQLELWMSLAFAFGFISFVIHTIQDYITSRMTSKLYAKGDFHNFFVVIGFDQILHYVQLFLTYHFLYH